MLDYAAMKREMPKLKAALTRAKRSGDPLKVRDACATAAETFNRIGWPDNWHTWNIALVDAHWDYQRSETRDEDPETFAREWQRFGEVAGMGFNV